MDCEPETTSPDLDRPPRSQNKPIPELRTPGDDATQSSEDTNSVSAIATGSGMTSPPHGSPRGLRPVRLTRPRSRSRSRHHQVLHHEDSLSPPRRVLDYSEPGFSSLFGAVMNETEGSGKTQQSSDTASGIEKEHTDNQAPLTKVQSTSEQGSSPKVPDWPVGRSEGENKMRDTWTQTIESEEGPELRTTIRILSKEKQDLEKLLTNLEATNDELTNHLSKKETKVIKLRKEIRQHLTRVKELETDFQRVHSTIAELEKSKITAKTNADNERQALERAVKLLEKSRSNAHELLANSEKKCVLLQDRMEALKRLNADLQECMRLHAKAVEDGNRTFDSINEAREYQVKQDLELLVLYDELEENLATSAPDYAHPTSAITPYEPQSLGDFVHPSSEFHRGSLASLANTPVSALSNIPGLPESPGLPQYGAASANLSRMDSRAALPTIWESPGLRRTMSKMKPYLLARSRAQTVPGGFPCAPPGVDILDFAQPNISRGRYGNGTRPIDITANQLSIQTSSPIVDAVPESSHSSSPRQVSQSPEAWEPTQVSGRRRASTPPLVPYISSTSPVSNFAGGVRLSRGLYGTDPPYYVFDQAPLSPSEVANIAIQSAALLNEFVFDQAPSPPSEAADRSSIQSASSFDGPAVQNEDLVFSFDRRRTTDYVDFRKSSEAISSSVSYHDTRNARRRSSTLVLSPSSIPMPKHEQPSSPFADSQVKTLVGSSTSSASSASSSWSDIRSLSSQNLSHYTESQHKPPAPILVPSLEIFGITRVEHRQTPPSKPAAKHGIPYYVEDILELLEKEHRAIVKNYLKTLRRKNRKRPPRVRSPKSTINKRKHDEENKILTTGPEQETVKVAPSDPKQSNSATGSDDPPWIRLRESSTSEQNAKYRPVAKVESAAEEDLADDPITGDLFETAVDGDIDGDVHTQLTQPSSQAQSLFATMMDRFYLNTLFGVVAKIHESKSRDKSVSPKAPATPLEAPREKQKSWRDVFETPSRVVYKYYNNISNSNNTINNNNTTSTATTNYNIDNRKNSTTTTTTTNYHIDNRKNSTHTYHATDNRKNSIHTTHITQMMASPNERRNLDATLWGIGVCFLALCLALVGHMLDHIPTNNLSAVEPDIAKLPSTALHSLTEYAGEEEEAYPSKAETATLMHPNPKGVHALLPSWVLKPQSEIVYSTVVESVNFFTVEETGKVVTETQWITVPDIRHETSIYTKTEQVLVPEIQQDISTLTETQQVTLTDIQQETITVTEKQPIPEIETYYKTVMLTETQYVTVPQVQHETYTITRLDYITLTVTAPTSPCPSCTPCETSCRTTPTTSSPDLASPPPSSSSSSLTGGDSGGVDSPDTSPTGLGSLRNLGMLGSIASNLLGSYRMIKPFTPFFNFLLPTTTTQTPCTCTSAPAPPPPCTFAPAPPQSCVPSGNDAPSTHPHPDFGLGFRLERSPNLLHSKKPRIDSTAKYRARTKDAGSDNRTLADILPAWAVTDPNRFAHIGPSHLGLAPWLQRLFDIFRFEVEEWARRSM